MSGHEGRSWPSKPVVRRRQTLPTLPATPTETEGPPGTSQTSEDRLERRSESWKRQTRSTGTNASTNPGELTSDAPSNTAARSRRLQVRHSGDGQATAHVGMHSISGSGLETRAAHRRLGRTPSSPSVLLSKVKERIREKVFETSAEWPHLAAIERERRQRAAWAFEQALRARTLALAQPPAASTRHGAPRLGPQHGAAAAPAGTTRPSGRLHASDEGLSADGGRPERLSGGGGGGGGGGAGGGEDVKQQRRIRIRSDPSRRSAPADVRDLDTDVSVVTESADSFDKSAARLAFRRRSISEDTYNRMPSHLHEVNDDDDPAAISSTSETLTSDSRAVGVVCSNEDLKAIFHQHKRRHSPAVSPTADCVSGFGLPPPGKAGTQLSSGNSGIGLVSSRTSGIGQLSSGTAELGLISSGNARVGVASHVVGLGSHGNVGIGMSTSRTSVIVLASSGNATAALATRGNAGLGLPSPGTTDTGNTTDRDQEMGSESCVRGPQLMSSASVEVLTPVASTSATTSVPIVAGFTPTVACITEQDSFELLGSVNSDTVVGTPPSTTVSKPSAATAATAGPSTVPDVVYDEHGQTWDVYGAEFDPLILGQAIQSYLEKIMARKAAREARTASSDKLAVDEPGTREDSGRRRQSAAGSVREPSRQRQRDGGALGFVMRYLCSSVWRQGQTGATVGGGDKI